MVPAGREALADAAGLESVGSEQASRLAQAFRFRPSPTKGSFERYRSDWGQPAEFLSNTENSNNNPLEPLHPQGTLHMKDMKRFIEQDIL